MSKRIIGLSLFLLVQGFVILVGPSAAMAQATTFTESRDVPFSLVLTPQFVPCLEEPIVADGTLHEVRHVTLDDSGGRHVRTLFNVQVPKFSAVGVFSGTEYLFTGPGHFEINDDNLANPPRVRTFFDVYHLIGPGGATNILARFMFHITINAEGEVTALIDTANIQCH